MITLLQEGETSALQVEPGEALWLEPEDVEKATGWVMKPEGFCKEDVCVPIPAQPGSGDTDDALIASGKINLSAMWEFMGKPVARSESGDVWSLGESAEQRNTVLQSQKAPDFTLPDLDGNAHSLTDFRRKRVLLITWASW